MEFLQGVHILTKLIRKHSYFVHFRFHGIRPLGRSQGGGVRGQNLELAEIFFSF